MANATYRWDVRDIPCVTRWYFEQDGLSPSYSSIPSSETLNAYRQWFASNMLDFPWIPQRRPFQCPLCLCYHSREFWTAFQHGYSCPHLAGGWYFCHSCDRMENFLTIPMPIQDTSPGPSPAPKALQTKLSDSLMAIGAQFPSMGRPPELELPHFSSGSARIPGIIISSASYESNQANATTSAHGFRVSLSEGAFGASHVRNTSPKSIKSDTNHYAKVSSVDTSISLSQPLGGGSQRVPTSQATNLVARLCGLVHNINKEWMIVLANEPTTLRHVLAYPIRSIFETGLRALQKWFGTRPFCFEDLYSLAHVILASACTFHEHEGYDWDTLAENLLQWAHLIEETKERAVYQRVLRSIWRARRISPITHREQRHNTELVCSRKLEPEWPKSQSMLLDEVRNGKAIRQGVEILDKFEHATIVERDGGFKHPFWDTCRISGNAQKIGDDVLRPLCRLANLEKVRPYIVKVQQELQKGRLLHPWDAEVLLISEGKPSFPELRLQDSFVHTVVTHFDNAMNDANWRDRYYAMITVQMLAIAHEVNKDRRRSWKGEAPYPDLLSSLHSQISNHTTAYTQASLLFDPTHQLHIQHNPTPLTSPREMSISPSRASGTDIIRLTDNWTCCPYEDCHVSFKAGPDQKSNCKRHIKTQHEEVETFRCPENGCERGFPNRWNVKRHVRGYHPHLRRAFGPPSPTHKGKGRARADG